MVSKLRPLQAVVDASASVEELTGQLRTSVAIFTELLRLIDERDAAAKS